MTAFVLFAHGSRVESANQSVRKIAAEMARSGAFAVEPAFLELGEPDLRGAVEKLAQRGAVRIVVIPYFLTLGTHMQRDLPKLAAESSAAHPQISIEISAPLDGHPALVDILLDRAQEALRHPSGEEPVVA